MRDIFIRNTVEIATFFTAVSRQYLFQSVRSMIEDITSGNSMTAILPIKKN